MFSSQGEATISQGGTHDGERSHVIHYYTGHENKISFTKRWQSFCCLEVMLSLIRDKNLTDRGYGAKNHVISHTGREVKHL